MRNKFKYIFVALFFCLGIQADEISDSINKEAEDPGFIHAYIELMSPGPHIYACAGHTALRLVCPSNNLDYCFTFEMDMEQSGTCDFLMHQTKAGFASAPTNIFFRQYTDEGRGITQYELNLLPKEKQQLWRFLDEQVAQGDAWKFDFYNNSCTSMVLWAIESSLEDSGELVFRHLPSCMHGSYWDAGSYMTEDSPWYKIAWRLILFESDTRTGSVEQRLGPRILTEVLPYCQITGSRGSRPLIKGKPQTLYTQTYNDKPFWFHPWMALVLILISTISLTYLLTKKQKKR